MESKLQQQVPQTAQVNKPNLTGIPTQMKLDFERRSGLSFDDVRVHYNSDKPAQFRALAYTQGTQVHVGPGQEQYLPHELGHVIQQKIGLVYPTKFVNGIAVNDSPALENMADTAFSQAHVPPKSKNYLNKGKFSNISQIVQRYPTTKSKTRSKRRPRLTPGPMTKAERQEFTDMHVASLAKNRKGKKPQKSKSANTPAKPQILHNFLRDRYVTMVGYRFTDMGKEKPLQPSKNLQGPHTIAHTFYSQLMSTKPWKEIYDKLITPNTPSNVEKIITTELKSVGGNTSEFKRFDPYMKRYTALFDNLVNTTDADFQSQDENVGTQMMEIIEMHPYSSYGWTRENKLESQTEIGGKGEQAINLNNINTANVTTTEYEELIGYAYDIHSKFNDMDSFEKFVKERFYFIPQHILDPIIASKLSLWKRTILGEYDEAVRQFSTFFYNIAVQSEDLLHVADLIDISDATSIAALSNALKSAFPCDQCPIAALDTIMKYPKMFDIAELKTAKKIRDILDRAYDGKTKETFAARNSNSYSSRNSIFYFKDFFQNNS